MTSALVVPSWLAVLDVLVVAGLVLAVIRLREGLRGARGESDRVLASAAADAEALRVELSALEEQLDQQAAQVEQARRDARFGEITIVDDNEYVITDFNERRSRGPLAVVPTVPTPVFVDIVLRESLIRTASLAAGLRRALAPDVRNRVRFEMKREVKRSRKQRRLSLRQARREWEARQRAEIDPA
ncbi:MAG TPA: hypothetical protein VNS55_10545 [Nocardioides sp.]|nr:hypothetical protein [Nocardioides sp.]